MAWPVICIVISRKMEQARCLGRMALQRNRAWPSHQPGFVTNSMFISELADFSVFTCLQKKKQNTKKRKISKKQCRCVCLCLCHTYSLWFAILGANTLGAYYPVSPSSLAMSEFQRDWEVVGSLSSVNNWEPVSKGCYLCTVIHPIWVISSQLSLESENFLPSALIW